MPARQGAAVRRHVADQTRDIHQALHDDPVLCRLTAPGITALEYTQALRALSSFYHAIENERQRSNHWAAFALDHECHALQSDLGSTHVQSLRIPFSNRFELLGGLYVAHGASFGRAQFRRNLRQWVPDMPQHFVGLRMNKTVWEQLTQDMETYGQNASQRDDLVIGAARSFAAVEVASNAVQTAVASLQI